MRRKLIVGNWKMNGSRVANSVLLSEIKSGLNQVECDVAVCVPAPYFAQCEAELSSSVIQWGGQDISIHKSGAYTGEVSGSMLSDWGCKYVIVGHSERRAYHAEGNELVARKVISSIKAGLTPIVCVGEVLEDREAGRTNAVVGAQLEAVLAAIESEHLENIVVAYEPVWAIGTGKTATPAMAQEVHQVLREMLSVKNAIMAKAVRILYGGSVKPDNARELFVIPDIDGGLIGGASLNSNDFLEIVRKSV